MTDWFDRTPDWSVPFTDTDILYLVMLSFVSFIYVAAKATFVCFMAKSAFGVFFGPSSVKRGWTHIVLG